jgi:ribose transport system permease protein
MIRTLRLDKFSALYLWALFMIYFGLTKRDTFFSSATFKIVIQENIIIGVLAVAFLIPLAAGVYDLSIGAMMSFALVISATFAQNKTMPNAAGMVVALIICGVAGAVSGFFVVKLKVNSFIATLGMSQVLSALILFTSSQSITGAFTDPFMNLGSDTFLGLARYVWYFLVLAVIVWFVLEHTPTGRYMYATGGNPEAARRSSRAAPASSTRGRSAATTRASAPATSSPPWRPCSSAPRSSRAAPTCGER